MQAKRKEKKRKEKKRKERKGKEGGGWKHVEIFKSRLALSETYILPRVMSLVG